MARRWTADVADVLGGLGWLDGLDRLDGEVVRAAGGLVWREEDGGPRLAVVHRPRQRDWSLPKGKLRDGESFAEAALREVAEETGWRTRLAEFAGYALYPWRGRKKLVLYWHMTAVRAARDSKPCEEVDRVEWLSPRAALEVLDRRSDRQLVRRALRGGRTPYRSP